METHFQPVSKEPVEPQIIITDQGDHVKIEKGGKVYDHVNPANEREVWQVMKECDDGIKLSEEEVKVQFKVAKQLRRQQAKKDRIHHQRMLRRARGH